MVGEAVPLVSEWLSEAAYDDEAGVMVLRLLDGDEWEIRVPKQVFLGLTSAPSPGRFYHLYVKNRY